MIAEDEWRMPTRPAATAADWALWSKLPTAEVLSAVVLSLGIEPLKLSTRRRFDEVERRYNALVPGFRSRYTLACANVSKTGPLHTVGSALLVNGRGGAIVSLPEFGAWAIGIGWELPERFPRCASAAKPNAVEPPAAEPAPAGDAGQTGSGTPWRLKRVARYPGYRKPLLDVLRTAYVAGGPRPTAREVLDGWQRQPPPEVVGTSPDSIDYKDSKGNKRTADLKAIQQAISNLTE